MPIVTPFDYESNEDLHGNYQWVTLKDIVDSVLLETQDDDSYLKNVKRSKIIYHAKQGIQEVHRKAANDLKAIEISVPDDLVFTLPQDYVNYTKFSLVAHDDATGSKRLVPLDINENINIATGYLQDSSGGLLFDNDGYILSADSNNAYNIPYSSYTYYDGGGQFMLDTSKLSQYGEFTIDKNRGKILFGSELLGQEVVLEYISDGLSAQLTESEIKVSKLIQQCIKDWIYYSCIATKRNVPANEKERALRRYKTTLHQAKLDTANFDLKEISRVLRSKTMFL
jgi:hypothetical protein